MSVPQNWHKWLVLSLLGLALSALPIGCDYSTITEKFGAEAVARCNEKCPFQNKTEEGHFDVSCGSECSVQQCTLGCSLWQEALENSCQTVCNVTTETVFSRELYCVMGCNEALNTYSQKLRELIGTPPAPALVADSLTATSLSLVWEAPSLSNLSYLVQWRYEELPSTWQYYSNTSYSDRPIIHVLDLRPYTKYRFRVAIFLSGREGSGEPVYSASSVVISTLESGKPSSAPTALRAAAPDPRRVAISWEPGPFPNGPLISYVLRLTDTKPNTIDALEDMPASNYTLFYMFQNLDPAREYEVSVAMRNAVGEGPRASVRISTPPLPTSVPSQQPILILGGDHNILAAPANDMLSDPVELYSTEYIITGVGLDISSDSLFVSVSNGFVYRSSLSKKSVSEPILEPHKMSYKPLDLSVDWLNRHLYVLGEVYYTKDGLNASNYSDVFPSWEIVRCDFDGKNQMVALAGLNSRPIHFEVDAYNGYLFWATRSPRRGSQELDLRSGLYRLDLANISNGVHHDSPPELIVRDAHLGAFTVDHADFRILVAHLKRNTVLAVSLDGREVSDFRSNTQKPMFLSTSWLAYAGGLFYWTNGREMLTEEYHAQTDSYYHNEYPLAYNNKIVARQVLVALRSCQPIPVPVNPPILVQSVMGAARAKVRWTAPHLLGHQGAGAWQRWSYRLQLTDVASGHVVARNDITESTYIVEDLKQDAEYVIKVAAVTKSGSGPWSSEFVGKTLPATSNTLNSTLLWSGPDGLLQTNLTGEQPRTLIYRDELKSLLITDISWYQDMLYLVTNASTVIWYNTTTKTKGFMPNMDNVGSMAVDWVGKKIYWSNPKQQLITRGNFDGSNREPVPIVTVAKELTIDSLRAYIYWNTGHAVEAARLNGENKMVYYPAQLFSGKQVMGITADLENKWLYWLVRSYDGSELHKAPTADQLSQGLTEISGTLVTKMSGTATLGPLCYFSSRLVWVQDSNRAVVADLTGRYPAELIDNVHVIAVRDPTLHAGSESLVAIPETIDASSIKVTGEWNNFNVSWARTTNVNVNNSRVYYDVSLQFPGHYKIEKTVYDNWVNVKSNSIPAYSVLQARVRAHTAWGAGAAARLPTATPQARPGPPARPRAYTERAHSGGPLSATFRWDSPAQARGVLRGYEVACFSAGSGCAPATLPPARRQLRLAGLQPRTEYYFEVRAHTDAGYGPFSEIVTVTNDEINPIPKVIMSSMESFKIIDLDLNESETIPKGTGHPVDFALSIEENMVYWANNHMGEIFSLTINGSGYQKLIAIYDSASSITLDWVSRSLYWSQLETSSVENHVLYRANLYDTNIRPREDTKAVKLFHRKKPMYSLQVVPSLGSLFWYEDGVHPGLGVLMTSRIDKPFPQPFFNNSERDSNCNCSENPQVAPTFFIDVTAPNYELYWVDPWTNQIIAADMNACKCRVVVDATDKKKYGFIPMSITADSKYIYWFNSTEKVIYYTTKKHKGKIEHIKTNFGYKIMALDPSIQPYPPKDCLTISPQNLQPYVSMVSANTMKLHLPSVSKPKDCEHLPYEMSVTKFTIYYCLHFDDPTAYKDCTNVNTTSDEVVVNELKPFTNYTVVLEATNYYGVLYTMKPVVGASLVVQTAAEAPSAPKHVKVLALSPVLARVQWKREPGLQYEVHWSTEDSPFMPHNLTEHNAFKIPDVDLGEAQISRLSPGTRYVVWVQALSPYAEAKAESKHIELRTYPDPPKIVCDKLTPYAMSVLWRPPKNYTVHSYSLEYTEVSTINWKQCIEDVKKKGNFSAVGLQPRTRYRFRLRLQYVPAGPLYHWPSDDSFTFETLGDVPGTPLAMRVERVGERVLRAWWGEPEPRGAPVDMYRLWGRSDLRKNQYIPDNITKEQLDEMLPSDMPADLDDEMKRLVIREGLELLHNGTETYWLLSNSDIGSGYSARVQAHNAHGWGRLSAPAALLAPPPRALAPPLAAAAAAAALLLAAAVATAACTYNKRSKKKAALENPIQINAPRRGPDVELATLRQLPITHSTNILYNQGIHLPSDAELSSLTHIRREQITLSKFLGSGAFGEVFEGVARQINGENTVTKVAVKTLRKGATEQEKAEFLKEASLMSNFKHEHILRLLGVCLDNDPNYIVMELMEGGDLLSYLRAKRASLYTPESLTLLDLLNMCVDVTKGCRYLEEMHFVHRDLACRNCLVAHRANGRVVKIGDFGLARDIYKNDYYRKEGEGLLPVRWMAVECLVDGVFSCQSDVWAWGVLVGEVLSLGQQPYPARSNRQVLAHVRAGGVPARPPNCPHRLYELLQKCWSYNPESRPSFRECLAVVTSLRDKTSPNIKLTAAPAHAPYLTLLGDDEDLPEEMEPSHLLPRAPKYLELMYDSDSNSGIICDGYEIPRAPISYAPFSRHSIVGVAPNRLIKPLYRTHSLRTSTRPHNATIIPLRNGLVKRASLCEGVVQTRPTSSRFDDVDKHVFKTTF